MTLDDGVLVSRRWLERVNQALFGHSQIAHEYNDSTSLFYDVRPAVLASAWSQNAAGVWTTTAMFLVNDVVDSSFVFPVVAPTATADPGGTTGKTRFFVIWRGRWEMIAGASTPQISIMAANFVTDVYWETKTISSASGTATASYTPNGSVLLSLDGSTPAATVGVVTDIQATGGVLGVQTQYLSASFSGTAATISSVVPTTSITVFSFLGAPKSAAVTNVSIS